MLENDIQEILFTEEQLKKRVNEIARQIETDYAGQEIMLISVLRGSFIFMADLCRAIDLPCTLDFMSVSSYGTGTTSSGQVQITKDLSEDITGRHIIVVEDILDSGNTLSYLLKILNHRHPASVRLCRSGCLPSSQRMTWEPWSFWVWSQMSRWSASFSVRRSFWRLFLPTSTEKPEAVPKAQGAAGGGVWF